MANNPQYPEILLFDKKAIKVKNNRQYLVLTGKGGEEVSISDKRESLWVLFDTAFENEAFIIVYEEYNKVKYVADVKRVADELAQRAVQNLAGKLYKGQDDERVRSQAIAYAKDLYCAGKIDDDTEFYDTATDIALFIKGERGKDAG